MEGALSLANAVNATRAEEAGGVHRGSLCPAVPREVCVPRAVLAARGADRGGAGRRPTTDMSSRRRVESPPGPRKIVCSSAAN